MRSVSGFLVFPKSRRSLQFSLRSLLITVALATIPLSYVAVVLREHENTLRLARELEKAGGEVEFDCDLVKNCPAYAEDIGLRSGWRQWLFGDERMKQIVCVTGPMTRKEIELLNRAKTIRALDFLAELDDDAFLSLAPNAELRHLGVRRAAITDRSMPHMRDFPRLKILDLREASIGDDGLGSLAGMRYIEELDVGMTGVTGLAMPLGSQLPRLREINVFLTAWTDEGVERLATIQTLEKIDLSGTSITDRSLAMLARLPRLRDLKIGDTRGIVGSGFCHLTEMRALTSLDASGLPLGDDAIAAIAKARGLTHLQLNHVSVSDVGAAELSRLENLTCLGFIGSQITDRAVGELARLSKLVALDLSGTEVTVKSLRTALPKMNALKSLALVQVSTISTKEVAELQKLVPNCEIQTHY